MIINIFNIFDPSTSNTFSLNWIIIIFIIFINFKYFWKKNNRIRLIYKLINLNIFSNFKNNYSKNKQKTSIIFIIIFILIYISNIISIFPFIFTINRHLRISLIIALPIWISLIIKIIIINTNKLLIHLVPFNTPLFLCPFIVIIESIRIIIRPITLAIRLTANIIAGHILLAILSQLLNNNLLIFLNISFVLNLLLILELRVAIIQAYVFTILLTLYFNEV